VSERRLRSRMAALGVPGEEEARERAWAVASRAFERRSPARPRRLRPVIALVLALGVGGAALAPPGQAVRHWVADVVGSDERVSPLGTLPAPGRLLVVSPAGPWVVNRDGERRRLGDFTDASWSPHGLFVAATRRYGLSAVEPDGDVRWSIDRIGPVRAPRWSSDGFRIAYLSGGSLRVVAGDGTGDRRLARAVGPVAAAWRPGAGHVLAYVGGAGEVRVVDADSRRTLWRLPPRPHVAGLDWSPDGRRLLVLSPERLAIVDARTRARRDMTLPSGARQTAATFAAAGEGLVVIVRRGDTSELLLVRPGRSRRLFRASGTFSSLALSPDGRFVAVAWPDTDQWLFVPVARGARPRAVSGVAGRFESGGRSGRPDLRGWCCPP
jgi:WD40 repeat protein